MKRFLKIFILTAVLALLNGTGFGNSGTVYQENFNSGNSLRDLGFTYFGLHSDGWKLNTAERYLESDPVKGHQKTTLYSPVFEANRNEGTVGLEWLINFDRSRPDHHNPKNGHHGKPVGKHHGLKHEDWVRVGLIGADGRFGYSLKFALQEKGKMVTLHAELEKNGKRLKSAPPNFKFSQDDWLHFRVEFSQPTPGIDKDKRKGKGGKKGINEVGEIKVYYGVNGSGFREWFAVKEKTPYTRLVKVFLDQEIDYYSNLQVKIDDLRVTGKVNDQTAPVTSHDYLYDGQWVKTPMTVNFAATDQGSGVAQIYHRMNGGESVAGNQIQFTIDGIYTIEYWAVDQAGNAEVPKSLTVKLDQALPTISFSLAPVQNSSGWNNTDVTVSFTGTDVLSGIASVSEPVLITIEGLGQVIQGEAVDQAGNVAETSVAVNLDKTTPVISNLQPANGAQINLKRPMISAGVFDELSGIDPGSVQLTLDGQLVNGSYDVTSGIVSYSPVTDLSLGGHTIAINALDLARNAAVSVNSFFTIIASGLSTTHDYLYDGQWVNTPVDINFTTTGQGSETAQIYYRINEGEIINSKQIQFTADDIYNVEYWAVDQDGNTEDPKSMIVKLDQVLPTISSSFTPVQNSKGWNNTNVTVTFTGNDNLSGIASLSEPVQVTTEGLGQAILGKVVDQAGNVAETSVTINLDKTPPVISNLQPSNGARINIKRPAISSGILDELSEVDPASIKLTIDGQLVNGSYNDISKIISYTLGEDLSLGSHNITLNVFDLAGNPVTVSSSFTIVTSDPNLPPDPVEVAPALDPTIVSDMKTAISFLYTGENPIQTGMDPETIEPRRAAVIRGKVLDKDGQPLSGVKIIVLNHGEYGQTLSRADGVFDLAVNGGGYLTVKYEKNGYLSAQRQVNAPWQDFVIASDVILLQPDTKVTEISLTETTQAQVAQGSVVTDEDGIRQATVIFPAGTKVTGLNRDTIHVRATEYTVGSNGPKAMPAVLPPAVAYTYCVDLTVDEAEGATFNQPVYFYVNNFLNFPVGGIVPVGYYDYNKAAWIPSENGRIIRILNVNDGMAEVDVSGAGQAADAEALVDLGFTEGELQKLAATYQAGQSIWRAPVTHFSPWDCNWPYGPPTGAQAPQQSKPQGDDKTDDPCEENGSIIEIQNQVLRESLNLTGTSFTLNYASDRASGRKAANMINAKLTGFSTNSLIKRVEVEINVAGKQYLKSYDPEPNLTHNFIWSGLDAYDRPVKGGQIAKVRVGYVYDAVYQQPAEFFKSFSGLSGIPLSANRARQEVTLWQEHQIKLYSFDAIIGGWELNIHHQYDPVAKILYFGNGERRRAESINFIIDTIAGGGNLIINNDGKPATEISFRSIDDIAFSPDGCIYISEYLNHRIRKVGLDGIVTTIAGGGHETGDGVPATSANLNVLTDLTVATDGSIYFADTYRIRRIDPNGIISTIAGTGEYEYGGDGGPAINAKFKNVYGMDIGSDGSIYVADSGNGRIRRISPDGIITTIAGTGTFRFSGDGGPAIEASFMRINDLAIGPDGSIYVSEFSRIRRIGSDGIITTIAGTGVSGHSGDGGPAKDANFYGYLYISVAKDGNIYVGEDYSRCIRKISPDGLVNTIAGIPIEAHAGGFSGDGGPALMATFNNFKKVIEGPDGSINVADYGNSRIRRISSVLPGFTSFDFAVPSKDGSELYRFNANGRHLSTINALTGTIIYTFNYNSSGHLIEVIDADNNTTTIERDANGNTTAITAPFGQRTTLSVNSEGYLETVTNPANETTRLDYYDGGLLATLTDPKGNVHRYTYDELGRLIKDEDPVGGCTTLERTENDNGHLVTSTVKKDSTSNYVTTYLTETLSTGETRRVTQGCCGGLTEAIIGQDGSKKVTYPDGTVVTTVEGPDPRFGMQAPIIKSLTVTTPSGLKYEMIGDRTATLSDSTDPLSLLTQTDMVTVNGKTYTTVYDAMARTATSTTPMGRQSVTTMDEKGRVVKVEVPGLAAVVFEYDERGRLVRTTEGSGSEARITLVTYASNGLVDYMTDPLGRQTRFEYDSVGRVTRQIMPGGKQINFAYDSNGNITELTPPGKPEHGFGYNEVDLNDTYNPPNVGIGATQTEYDYNLAKQPTIVTRPDGKTIGFSYDTSGRLQELLIPEGDITYAYHADTGNLTNIFTPDGTMSYSYDGSLQNKTAWSGAVVGNVGVTYNNDFMVTSQSVNDGNSVSYGYDDDGLLVSAGSLTVSRNEQNGMITGSSIGSVSDSVTYNGFGELRQYQARYGGSTVYSLDYGTRDKSGRIVTKTETVGGETHTFSYVYDSNTDELTDVYKDGSLVSHYDYDANGNRVKYTGASGTFNGTYDAQDRMLSYGGNTYQYTANGELKSKANAEGTTVYNYDVLGNLRAVTLPDGTRIEYVIDGQNRRIGKKVNGALVQGFLYSSQLTPIAELDANGNVVARFVYGTRGNVPDYVVKGGVTYRVVSDHLGSPRVIINVSTGEVVQRMEFDEFGKVTLDTNPGFQPFGFAGGIYDKDTGLVRFGARDYDAETGRWTEKDPIGFNGGDTDLYSYVGNDPVNYIDPDGLARGDWWDVKTYLPDLNGAIEIADEVLIEAQNKGLPGIHNGEADAWRHAQWNKRMVEELDWLTAVIAGYGHEFEGAFQGQPWNEFWMDLHNNREGRRIANEKDPCDNDITSDDLLQQKKLRVTNPSRSGRPRKKGGWY